MMKYMLLPALVTLLTIAGCSTPQPPRDSSKDRTISDLGLAMILLEPGEFTMGSEQWGNDEKPAHKVKISKPFWIGKTEINQTQYEKLSGKNPSLYNGKNSPVEQVSWDNAVEFCKKLTDIEKKAGRLQEGYVYRLPTEAEWEYACRAGTAGDYSGDIEELGWIGSNSKNTTQDVATKSPNPWGICDMYGNVWEWCLDSCEYGENGVKTDVFKDGVSDPYSSKGDFRILKGGSWCFDKKFCRSSTRYADKPDFATADIGFRIALAPIKP